MSSAALAHIPGTSGAPVVGHTLAFLRDARGLMDRNMARYGDVFTLNVLGRQGVTFVTPEATRQMYLDPDQVFSSKQGWSNSIGPLFQKGLMLRDFEDHHVHRLVMAHAFRRAALSGYVTRIHQVVDRHLELLDRGPVDVYLLMKRITLDIAAEVFVGASLGAASQRVNDAFVAMMRASITPVRTDLPGTPYRAGLRARRELQSIFGALVRRRRAAPESADLLSRLSHATGDDGEALTVDEVVDHMIFLLLAAHDTTTATLSVLLYELAGNPSWQDRVRAEVAGLGGAEVTMDNHRGLTDLTRCMHEALRLSPPVPFSPRVALRDTVIDGWEIAGGTPVTSASVSLHRHPAWWTEPDRFDPDRFSPERAEDKQHTHLFVPFGGGAHLCIGNHLAELITKSIAARLLADHQLRAVEGARVEMAPVPIPKPRSPLLVDVA